MLRKQTACHSKVQRFFIMSNLEAYAAKQQDALVFALASDIQWLPQMGSASDEVINIRNLALQIGVARFWP